MTPLRHSLVRGLMLAVLVLLQGTLAAQACSLDGIASLSLNGVRATLTPGTATPATAGYWAPFTLLAAGRGTATTLQEEHSNVVKSLTAHDLATPFLWHFAGGTTARGWQVVHRFSTLGWQRFTVSYYWPAGHRWIEFDSAQLQIVPPAGVFSANLGYQLENLVGTILVTALRVAVWAVAAVIAGAWILTRIRRRRR